MTSPIKAEMPERAFLSLIPDPTRQFKFGNWSEIQTINSVPFIHASSLTDLQAEKECIWTMNHEFEELTSSCGEDFAIPECDWKGARITFCPNCGGRVKVIDEPKEDSPNA
jgi:hypothetical protein